MALWRRAFRLKECNRPPTFWSKPVSNFGFSKLTRVQTTVHLRCAYGTCLASTPLSLLAVSAPCHQDGPSSEEYIVPGASYPIVTHRACPGRQLLVAQQVAASTAFIRRSKCDKAKVSFAVLSTSCRLTGDGRRHVSHSVSLCMALSGLALFMITRFYPSRDHFTSPPSEQSRPRLPRERCGKTNASNCARLNCVGIACPR